MKKILIVLSITFLLQLALVSCSKKDSTPPVNDKTVYISGFTRNSSGSYENSLWKNGSKTILEANSLSANNASSVFVFGTDVYLAGQIKNPVTNKYRAVIWKNAIVSDLTNGSDLYANATSIYVFGADVYAAGIVQDASFTNYPVYWKNGTKTTLSLGSQYGDMATVNGIFANGTDVYVTGTAQKNTGVYDIVLWKNGTISTLATSSSDFTCTGMVVSGSDVYISGYENDHTNPLIPRLWKNGIAQTLNTPATTAALANCVFVNGGDVYVGGYIINSITNEWNARYWKNGNLVTIPDGPKSSIISSMYVDGNDVYAVGFEENGTRKKQAILWKNGVATALSGSADLSGEAFSVIVK